MNSWRGILFALLLASTMPVHAAPIWIEHASTPGPDQPSTGLSRFDQLFLQDDNRYRIPYPLSALVATLEAHIDNGSHGGVRQVLIPIGRSLQRDAPAPDYFDYPRVVLALEGEPVTAVDEAGHVLEYRLFIAHQPKTDTLEIISYNDSLGRFEFQVVEDYAANATPRVRSASRALCLSCHQNGGAIFARQPWSETSFNLHVANRLIATLPPAERSLIGVITNDAGVIDVLSERANYLSAAQFIWRQGCRSDRCRAALLRAILQYRLSDKSSFDWQHASFVEDFTAELVDLWQVRWPDGIALANSRIPDRDPFAAGSMTRAQDPLTPRVAHATWTRVDSILAHGIVYRLAGFFTQADIERIDRRLQQIAAEKPVPIRRHVADCRLEASRDNTHDLQCGDPAGSQSLQARLELEVVRGRATAIRINALQLPQDPNIWQSRIVGITQAANRTEVELAADDSLLSLRLANGDRINGLNLVWSGPFSLQQIALEVTLTSEFAALDEALDRILENNRRGLSDSLSKQAFRRSAILPDLIRQLRMPVLSWMAGTRPQTPAPPRVLTLLDDELALLQPYCAHCHAQPGIHPPGFLYGADVNQRILACAPRILARLAAWQHGRYPPAPMPPPASLAISGSTAESWPQSDHYKRLVARLRKLVELNYSATDIAAWKRVPYRALPSCALATSGS